MIFKWKKKSSKQELFDIIKIQEEEISRLYKEKRNFYIVIRNKKPIRIEKQGLDYMVELEQKLQQKENILKEVREELNKIDSATYQGDTDKKIYYKYEQTKIQKLLEILDKGSDKE